MQNIEPLGHAHVTTDTFAEHKRLATWQEIYGRGIANVDIEPIGGKPFRADVTFNLLPNVSIAAGSRSPAHYRVTRELAGRGRDMIALSILRSGAASATQFGNELISGVGSASVLVPTDPSTSTLYTDGSFITLALSRRSLAALVPDLSQAFGRPVPGSSTALRLLTRYLEVVQAGDELTHPRIGQSVSDHIIDLAALALGARGDYAEMARARGARAARLGAMKSDILRELGRGDLSADLIAARHGISPRYVRKLFEQDGSSFSAFVLHERLVKAHRMLIDRRCNGMSIAQIVYASGFGDISYFNRAFRRHFGATPSDFREAARRSWREGLE
ncbi:AraC family transcriptional regulator [Bradyrhizobium sediminis]|uniref:AraC family transcriptional regulator n=1 Tax=Bradyrhizobium sediminis TaxID=2840469 RepID=A0A975RXF9_9BRAD|nr:AraC family transcriptional regulator [Bradyrhizobium sediminis]QWG22966.1 AraC family transcriptional regulator [Bradyrhizobium sediminis]